MRRTFAAMVCLATLPGRVCLPAADGGDATHPQIVEVNRIWDEAPHNAFTDLARFRDRWYCVFREATRHVSKDGTIRLLTSPDGARWESAAHISVPGADLRDPKLAVTPDLRLALNAVAAYPPPLPLHHQSVLWYSLDGRDWSDAIRIGDPNVWLWRVQWYRGKAYSLGYSTQHDRFIRAYVSLDGRKFEALSPSVFTAGYPNESVLLFDSDDSALCLLRRDGDQPTAQLGSSKPPYRAWTWRDLGVQIGGPNMIRIPDGRIVAAGRLYDGRVRTSLCWLDPDEATLTEFLALPSGGDNSYPGLVFHDGLLWLSYYSSDEGKTSIYLAKVKLPEARKPPARPKLSF